MSSTGFGLAGVGNGPEIKLEAEVVMQLNMLKCKIHRATVTDANLNYEGSISICGKLAKRLGCYYLNKLIFIV